MKTVRHDWPYGESEDCWGCEEEAEVASVIGLTVFLGAMLLVLYFAVTIVGATLQ